MVVVVEREHVEISAQEESILQNKNLLDNGFLMVGEEIASFDQPDVEPIKNSQSKT